MTVEDLRGNLIAFVCEIAAVAEEEGARLAIHPDDPSFPIFGLPRVMSTAEDFRQLFTGAPSRANGMTLCAGSLGSNPQNDVVAMAKAFGPRVHFAHLRNVKREPDGSFFEADHLAGETDMVRLVAALMAEEDRRRAEGRAEAEIPMRPDHGHLLGPLQLPHFARAHRLKTSARRIDAVRRIVALGPVAPEDVIPKAPLTDSWRGFP